MENQEKQENKFSEEVPLLKKRIAEMEAEIGACRKLQEQTRIEAINLRYLTQYANDFMFLLDQDFLFLEVNERVIDFYGYTRQELIGMHATQLRAPETKSLFFEQIKPAQMSGQAVYDTVHQRKDGTVFPVEISLRSMDIEGKRFYQAIIRDITERQKAEKKLQESYGRYHNLFENMSSGVAVYQTPDAGENFIILGFNRAAEQSSKISRQEVIGKNVLEVFPALKEIGLFEVFQQVYRTGEAVHFPVVMYKDKRVVHWVKNFIYKLSTGEIVSIYDDVTEAKSTEDKIKGSENFLKTIIENLPNMIFVKEAKELRFLRFNKAGQDLLGYSEQELCGKNDFDLFPKEIADFFTTQDREAFRTKQCVDIPEEIIKTRSGQERVLHTKKIPIFDEEGNPLYLLGISEDITESKRIKDELSRKTEFLEARNEASLEGVLVVDEHGQRLLINQRLINLWKVPAQVIADKNDQALLDYVMNRAKDPGQFLDKVNYLYAHKEEKSQDLIEFKDGTVFDRYSSPVIDKEGKYFGRIWTFRDVTELNLAQAKLKNDLRELEVFYKSSMGREERIIELKEEVERLKKELNKKGL